MTKSSNTGFPKISIVTPSFNQGKFIEETIMSVIGQGYPNLEYIIIDGGSTDETVDIIKKYEKHLTYWISEKDNGQSHAINKGFAVASGDILGWLNSDDMYMPYTFSYISKLVNIAKAGIYFGNCIHFKENAEGLTSFGSNIVNFHFNSLLTNIDYIIQPSSFWTKQTWREVGNLREDLHYGFDWEWYLRAQTFGINFESVSKCLSMYRFHETHKSSTGGLKRLQELCSVYNLYSKHAEILFRMLIVENINIYSFTNKVIVRTLREFKKPHTYGDILKLLKPKKYSGYTAKEINDLKCMI